jgi:hypothetical protein
MKRMFLGAAVAAGVFAMCNGGLTEEVRERVWTFDDILAAGIASFVDKDIVIEGVVTWATPTVKIPEDSRTPAMLAALAGPVKVKIQGKSFEELAGRDALLLISDKLSKVKGEDGAEQWAFSGKRLVRDGDACCLRVRILLRASFKKELLQNPAFIKQCNQPKYWSQTFEMRLFGVEQARGTTTP